MTKQDARERIEKLKKEINYHRYRYHVLDAPVLSDEATDALKHELSELEKQYPELRTSDSPSQRIGGIAREEFKKIRHSTKQWSLNDAFNENGVHEFHDRTVRFLKKSGVSRPKPTYTAELKIDGLHIVLTYQKGILTVGATRGDGIVGEDVTTNLQTIESIPLRLEEAVSVVVEGEAWLSKKQFQKINTERRKSGETRYANPRNTAAGTIRQLDSRIVRKRKLDSFVYDIASSDILPDTQKKELAFLKKLGFKVNREYSHCKTTDEIINFWKLWKRKKDSLPYMIDGIVIKVNERRYQERLGYTGKAPRFALALKFEPQQTTTTVEDILVQVGRTGALTPVAVLKPVQVGGSTVKRATLHNEDEIKRLSLKIGDTIVIQKAGDIIPEVVEVLRKLRPKNARSFTMPKRCPRCKGKTTRKKGEVALYCENPRCFAQVRAQMIHFVSKGAFTIDGLGDKIVEQLMDVGLVRTPSDIFSLTKDDLIPLERMGEKSADKLIKSIRESKKIDEGKFIFSLGIRFVGSETAYLIAQTYAVRTPKDLLGILQKKSIIDLENIDGVGNKTAKSIYQWFKNAENKELISRLHSHNISFTKQLGSAQSVFNGKTVVLTGTLKSFSRDELKDLLKREGARVSSKVSTKTDYVVVGKSPGAKYKEANRLGIRTLTESEFTALIRE